MEGNWSPKNYLKEVSYERARLSSDFLMYELGRFFPNLIDLWRPLYHSLGINEPEISYQLELESGDNLDGRIAAFEINSSPGYILIDQSSLEVIYDAVIANSSLNGSEEILLGYLLRRLLVGLEKTWIGASKLKVAYLGEVSEIKSEQQAKIKLRLELNNKVAIISVLLPSNLVDIFSQTCLEIAKTNSNEKSELTVELFDLFILPGTLLESLRNNKLIPCASVFSDKVGLYANGRPWAQGILRTCRDRFAIEISSMLAPSVDSLSSHTRVSVQLDQAVGKLDLKSYKTVGSIILTDARLNSPLSLLVSGEKIAQAVMSIDENNYPALKLLSN